MITSLLENKNQIVAAYTYHHTLQSTSSTSSIRPRGDKRTVIPRYTKLTVHSYHDSYVCKARFA